VFASYKAGWDLDPGGLSPTLVSLYFHPWLYFHKPLFIYILYFHLMFIYIFINMKSICDLWCFCICPCCIRVISWFESPKRMNKPYHTCRRTYKFGFLFLLIACLLLKQAVYTASLTVGLLKAFHRIVVWKRCVYQLWLISNKIIPRVLTWRREVIPFSEMHELL